MPSRRLFCSVCNVSAKPTRKAKLQDRRGMCKHMKNQYQEQKAYTADKYNNTGGLKAFDNWSSNPSRIRKHFRNGGDLLGAWCALYNEHKNNNTEHLPEVEETFISSFPTIPRGALLMIAHQQNMMTRIQEMDRMGQLNHFKKAAIKAKIARARAKANTGHNRTE